MEEKYYQLTEYDDTDFAQRTADNINKSYHNVASVREKVLAENKQYPSGLGHNQHKRIPAGTRVTACFITGTYWEFCKKVVEQKCRIKQL